MLVLLLQGGDSNWLLCVILWVVGSFVGSCGSCFFQYCLDGFRAQWFMIFVNYVLGAGEVRVFGLVWRPFCIDFDEVSQHKIVICSVGAAAVIIMFGCDKMRNEALCVEAVGFFADAVKVTFIFWSWVLSEVSIDKSVTPCL